MDRVAAAIALGSNLGDRAAHFDHAISRLGEVLEDLRVSRIHETVPINVRGPQSLFLNAAVVGLTSLSAKDVLEVLLTIERERWRERPHANAARTLDLDLILFGNVVADEPGLVVPHPRFRDRLFVLEPLAELAPDMCDPVTGLTVAELLDRAGK